MKRQLTYETFLKELSTKKLSKLTIPRLIEKCSQVIDELGCEILRQYSESFEFTPEMLVLKRKQKKLIDIRDILFNTYNTVMYDLKPTGKMDTTAVECIAREYSAEPNGSCAEPLGLLGCLM